MSQTPTLHRQFLQCVLSVLRADGNVLIPCDTTGRCLELVKLLEHQWAKLRLPYGLALCTSVALTTLDNAKAMMEWMKESLLDDLHQRENPWTLRWVWDGMTFHTFVTEASHICYTAVVVTLLLLLHFRCCCFRSCSCCNCA